AGDRRADVGAHPVDGRNPLAVAGVDVGAVGEHVAGGRGIAGEGGVGGVEARFGDDIGAVDVGDRDRRVVGAGDGGGQRGRGGGAIGVLDAVRELLGDDRALGGRVGVWFGIVGRVGRDTVFPYAALFLSAGDRRADVG